jgi:hypothetical protein
MGVVGLIFGIISLVTCWLGIFGWAGLVPGIFGFLGIILSAIGIGAAKKNNKSAGAAIAGLVLSIIGLLVGAGGLIACTICAGAAIGGLGSYGGW